MLANMINHSVIALLSLFSVLLITGAEGSKNPCHGGGNTPLGVNIKGGFRVNCQEVILPPGFCASCKFGDITSTGHYVDCTRTIDLENEPAASQCLEGIQNYVDLNEECDPKRKQALEDYTNPLSTADEKEIARQKLDFFVYAFW